MERVQPITVEQICDIIGRRVIADAVGVRLTSVSNAVTDGRFPARWFDVIDGLCRHHDLSCPRSLFSFIAAAVTSNPNPESSHDNPPEDRATNAA